MYSSQSGCYCIFFFSVQKLKKKSLKSEQVLSLQHLPNKLSPENKVFGIFTKMSSFPAVSYSTTSIIFYCLTKAQEPAEINGLPLTFLSFALKFSQMRHLFPTDKVKNLK